MSVNPSPEVILVFVMLVIVGPLLMIFAVIILAVPGLRRRTGLRRTGYVSLCFALCLVIPLAILVVISL